jgi:hypothetical protein
MDLIRKHFKIGHELGPCQITSYDLKNDKSWYTYVNSGYFSIEAILKLHIYPKRLKKKRLLPVDNN